MLEQPAPLERLLEAIGRHDRLVLLGDAVELAEAKTSSAMEVAEPILRAIGATLGPDRDGPAGTRQPRPWSGPWLGARAGEALTLDSLVPADSSPMLARIAGWLAPGPREVRYPGVWLNDTVWATHGHYLDRHLMPVSAFGVIRGRRPLPAGGAAERLRAVPSTQLGRALRWLPSPLAARPGGPRRAAAGLDDAAAEAPDPASPAGAADLAPARDPDAPTQPARDRAGRA